MISLTNIISDTPLFNGLPEKQIKQIESIAVIKKYSKGEVIFLDGDNGDGFYIVAQGKVKIYKSSSEGKEQILHIFSDGEPFGEVPVFTGQVFQKVRHH